MEELEAKEKPEDEAKESEAYQELEDELGVEKHCEKCPTCGHEKEPESDDMDETEEASEKPGLFSKAPKMSVIISAKRK
jgi:hypothetical protein